MREAHPMAICIDHTNNFIYFLGQWRSFWALNIADVDGSNVIDSFRTVAAQQDNWFGFRAFPNQYFSSEEKNLQINRDETMLFLHTDDREIKVHWEKVFVD